MTDTQTDTQTDRQTDRQTERQTDRETARRTDGQTDSLIVYNRNLYDMKDEASSYAVRRLTISIGCIIIYAIGDS